MNVILLPPSAQYLQLHHPCFAPQLSLSISRPTRGKISFLKVAHMPALTLTVSVLAVSQRWRHGDDASLPHAHAQKTPVHASDQPADAHVGVVGSQARVTVEERRSITMRFEPTSANSPAPAGLTWSQRASRPAACRCSGSARSPRLPPSCRKWPACGRS